MVKQAKKKKIPLLASSTKETPDITFTTAVGLVTFEVELSSERMQWELPGIGRKLEIGLYANIENIELYKNLHGNLFGRNYIKEELFLNDNLDKIDGYLTLWKQRRLLLDFIIVEATIAYDDPADNFYGEFSFYHGCGFTINGRKHLEQYQAKSDA